MSNWLLFGAYLIPSWGHEFYVEKGKPWDLILISLISNTIIYYPDKSNQNNIFLRTKNSLQMIESGHFSISKNSFPTLVEHQSGITLICLDNKPIYYES